MVYNIYIQKKKKTGFKVKFTIFSSDLITYTTFQKTYCTDLRNKFRCRLSCDTEFQLYILFFVCCFIKINVTFCVSFLFLLYICHGRVFEYLLYAVQFCSLWKVAFHLYTVAYFQFLLGSCDNHTCCCFIEYHTIAPFFHINAGVKMYN